ncbi:MAG: aminotransferase class I/II-fold pyridoxal phosphate-dependent enzyme [Prevotella sp.]|nr:aminotransferase class I/II-fold pyridoxal phosphate-dependent enzyme [Prevotella sp.]
MIKGHGNDQYRYGENTIRYDFSSNICMHAPHHDLMQHLADKAHLLSSYPEPEAWSLEKLLAANHGISPSCVIVTSGATEAIYLVAQAFRMERLIQAPAFQEYEDACSMFPVRDPEHKLMWICNPNNPMGCLYSKDDIEKMLADYDLVVADQSYEHYTDAAILTPRQAVAMKRVVQIHSMTKTYGVPGLRLGYITAAASLCRRIRPLLRPWAVSSLAIEAGKYLLEHPELVCKPDLQEAQRLRTMLLELGLEVSPTATNFMLCKLPEGHTAARLKDILATRHGMLIRDASNFRSLSKRHFRVAALSQQANNELIEAISTTVGGGFPASTNISFPASVGGGLPASTKNT